MMWGLAAGLPAGLLGGRAAAVLHLPTRLLISWVAIVAHRAGALHIGMVGAPHLAGLAAGVGTARLGRWIASVRAPRSRSP
jgi:hypothetical protein